MRGAVMVGGIAVVAGASAAVFHPVAALVVVLLAAAAAWMLSNALNATLAFIMGLVLRPAELVPALAAVQPAKLVGFVALFSWLITKLFRGDAHISRAPHLKWMLVLLVGVFLSSVMGTAPSESLDLIGGFVKMVVICALLVHLVDTKSRVAQMQLTLAFCTLGLALYAIYLRSAGLATIEGNRAGFVGLLEDPNDLALVLLMYVPLFAELSLSVRGVQRLVWGALLMTLIAGIFATVSRGGAVGLLVALGLVFYDRGSLRLRVFVAPALAVVVAGLLLVAGVNQRTSGAMNTGELDESAEGRLDMWESGIRMAAHHPLFGVGFGQFPENYLTYAEEPVLWGSFDAHNSFIKAAGETGLVGFIPFMALVVLTFMVAIRLRKADVPSDSPMDRAVRRALLPSIAGFCVSAFFLSQCWGWFFFLMFAQAAAMDEVWRPETDPVDAVDDVGTIDAFSRPGLGE